MKKITFIISFLFCNSIALSARSLPEVNKLIQDNNVTFGSALFTTVDGDLKSVTFPHTKFESVLQSGFFFDGSSVGFARINKSDLLAKIDTDALYISPYQSSIIGNTGFAFCDTYDATGNPFALCPRALLKKALQQAHDAGFSCDCGVELEFFIFKNNNGQLNPCDGHAYCDAVEDVELDAFTKAMFHGLTQAGITLEKMHHEVAPGQYEFILKHDNPLKIADSLLLAKHLMRTMAQQNGLTISFMPKPLPQENGTGMHIHFSLWNTATNTNAFYHPEGPAFLSDIALQFIAGNLHAMETMNLLLNPSVNSYKRLVPGYEAPTYLAWGAKNRSTAIRIPEVTKQDHEASNGAPARIEFRSPDATCNPYLAFASIIFAGLEGIKEQRTVAPSTDQNLYHVSQQELQELGINALPGSLEDAITRFEASIFAKTILGQALHTQIVTTKKAEYENFLKTAQTYDPFTVTNWEYAHHKLG